MGIKYEKRRFLSNIHGNEINLIEHFTMSSSFPFLIRSLFQNNTKPYDCEPFIMESAAGQN